MPNLSLARGLTGRANTTAGEREDRDRLQREAAARNGNRHKPEPNEPPAELLQTKLREQMLALGFELPKYPITPPAGLAKAREKMSNLAAQVSTDATELQRLWDEIEHLTREKEAQEDAGAPHQAQQTKALLQQRRRDAAGLQDDFDRLKRRLKVATEEVGALERDYFMRALWFLQRDAHTRLLDIVKREEQIAREREAVAILNNAANSYDGRLRMANPKLPVPIPGCNDKLHYPKSFSSAQIQGILDRWPEMP